MDKFPKARCHLLVMARDPALERITRLQPTHLPLLQHMLAVGERVAAAQRVAAGVPVRRGLEFNPFLGYRCALVSTITHQTFDGTW